MIVKISPREEETGGEKIERSSSRMTGSEEIYTIEEETPDNITVAK